MPTRQRRTATASSPPWRAHTAWWRRRRRNWGSRARRCTGAWNAWASHAADGIPSHAPLPAHALDGADRHLAGAGHSHRLAAGAFFARPAAAGAGGYPAVRAAGGRHYHPRAAAIDAVAVSRLERHGRQLPGWRLRLQLALAAER